MEVLRTERLVLRRLTLEDAAFIRELVNDPDWLRFIGDRAVRSCEDARDYLLRGPIAMYASVGFGLLAVERKEDRRAIGICGLIKRDWLEDVDIGFAFLPQFRSHGYAHEAAAATLRYAVQDLSLSRVVAVVAPENEASIRLLRRLGLELERKVRLPGAADELSLFGFAAEDTRPSGPTAPALPA